MSTENLKDEFEDRLRAAAPLAWLQQMHQYYLETGSVRPEDLHRLLGDPLRRVEAGAKQVAAFW